jgi:hypothetical protein
MARENMERLKLIIIALFLAFFPLKGIASSYYGGTFSYVEFAKEPLNLHGYQFLLNYDPQCFQWRQFNLYFDGGVAQLWITNRPYYTTLTVYSLSPIVRYSFKKRGPFSPYLEMSIGLAYLNHTRLDDRNFGMHPSIADRLGAGFYIGSKQQFSLGIHTAHYSNAHLADYNSGITIPMEIDIGYRFSL